jgi:hypothetical protein
VTLRSEAAALAELRSGPVDISVGQLAKRWGWSKSKTARHLDKWVKNGKIAKSRTDGGRLRIVPVTVLEPEAEAKPIPEREPAHVSGVPAPRVGASRNECHTVSDQRDLGAGRARHL